ncbi:DNA cytosine methyltransferase [Caldisphaera sp.]|uniref:DNA cytosine methyltransferase n=1 Tax=Caldisphaera sp. TaxID=2060322 RepID=UPI0025BD5991|nr:DNA cytosine methyltransferase [Caldisphaera sp.]
MRAKFSVLDIFSGAGGFSRGFKEAGFDILVSIENDPPVSKTYKANFPETEQIADDVKEIDYNVLKSLGYQRGDFDVIIASPPCEPFTPTNKNRKTDPIDRLYCDPIGQLYLHAIRIINEVRPKFFVIENVAGILQDDIKESIFKELKRSGYDEIYFNVLYAEHHGVPSMRTRVFVSNLKLELKKQRMISVEEALKDLPNPGSYWPPNHEEPQPLTKRLRKRVSNARWGRAMIEFEGAENKRFRNFIRLNPYRPAPTVMGSSRFIHPFEDRLLTVREQARLMGFPDYHVFLGGRDSQYNMIGEAVPPPLSKEIALYVMNYLKENIVNRGVNNQKLM